MLYKNKATNKALMAVTCVYDSQTGNNQEMNHNKVLALHSKVKWKWQLSVPRGLKQAHAHSALEVVTAKVLFLCLCFWEESLSSWLFELAITTGTLNKTMSPPNKTTIDLLTLQEENTRSPTDSAARRGGKTTLLSSCEWIRLWPWSGTHQVEHGSSPTQQVLHAPVAQTQMCTILPKEKKTKQIPQCRSQSNKN